MRFILLRYISSRARNYVYELKRIYLIFFICFIFHSNLVMIALLVFLLVKYFVQNIMSSWARNVLIWRWISHHQHHFCLWSEEYLKLKWFWFLFIFYSISCIFFVLFSLWVRVLSVICTTILVFVNFYSGKSRRIILEFDSNSLNWSHHFYGNRHKWLRLPAMRCKFIFIISKIFSGYDTPPLNKLTIKTWLKFVNWPFKKYWIITSKASNFLWNNLTNFNCWRDLIPILIMIILKAYFILLFKSWWILVYFQKRRCL